MVPVPADKRCRLLSIVIESSTSVMADSVSGSVPFGKMNASTKVYEIDPTRDPRWAALVNSDPRASVFHSPYWLQTLQVVYGYEPVVVTTCPPNERLANGLAFCRIKSWLTGRRLVSLPFSDHCEPLTGSPDELDALIMHVNQQVNKNEWKYIGIRPVSCQPSHHTDLSRVVTYYLHCLDLRPSTEQLFRTFHKSCVQRKIHRAEREKLKYEAGASEDLLRKFYRLMVMTRRRQHLPPQPLNWFRGLIAAFGNNLKIRVASKDGVAIASILTISHKRSMFYKYGCSNLAFNKLGGTALLFWKTIQEAKDRGFDEFEMGRSDVENRGLITFKEHWGASGKLIDYWTYPRTGAALLSFSKASLSRRVVSTVPDLALEKIGKFLYKHIG